MMVQSPLKRREVQPNLRKVSKPDISTSSASAKKQSNAKRATDSSKTGIPKIKPGVVILWSLIIGAFGFAYLTHVFATQSLLEEVQALENEYNKARQTHDELKLQYDRMVGPAEIYDKAQAAGFINGGPAEYIIEVEE
ncbi:MAG: hypothetical protein JJ895_11090 [Balneolaceae bacterium]|nr:hypothetical protein [Balneolaceae bacterium]